jgi:hypothetical protein
MHHKFLINHNMIRNPPLVTDSRINALPIARGGLRLVVEVDAAADKAHTPGHSLWDVCRLRRRPAKRGRLQQR